MDGCGEGCGGEVHGDQLEIRGGVWHLPFDRLGRGMIQLEEKDMRKFHSEPSGESVKARAEDDHLTCALRQGLPDFDFDPAFPRQVMGDDPGHHQMFQPKNYLARPAIFQNELKPRCISRLSENFSKHFSLSRRDQWAQLSVLRSKEDAPRHEQGSIARAIMFHDRFLCKQAAFPRLTSMTM